MIKHTNKQKTVFVLSAISLALSVGLSTFVVNGEVNDVSSVHESDATFEKVCINKTKNKEYASLNYAMNEAEANDEIYVYPGNDQKRNEITIISDLVIKEGVSLYVPYKTDENGNYVYNATNDEIETLGNTYADQSTSKPAKLRTLITFLNDADLIINKNAHLYLGGEFKTYGINNYTEIRLGKGSHIKVSGEFQCLGYVKELNDNPVSIEANFNNILDSERYIVANEGGKIYTGISIYDMKSGNNLMSLHNLSISPISRLDFPYIQTYLKLETGSEMTGSVRATISDSLQVVNAGIVGNNENYLFTLNSGYLGIEYIPLTTNLTTNVNGETYFYLGGNISLSKLQVNIIDTSKYFLPISHKFHINMLSGSVFNANNNLEFLPGSSLNIQKGALLEINSPMIFYKSNSLEGIQLAPYISGKEDARLVNNGIINIHENGTLGAYIETEALDDSAEINLLNSGQLTSTATEGLSATKVSIISSGMLIDDDNNISKSSFPGNVLNIKSAYNSELKQSYWNALGNRIFTLTINVEDMGYKYNALGYQVYYSADGTGKNEVELSTGVQVKTNSYEIAENSSFKVIANDREKSIEFNEMSLNTYGNFENGLWYESKLDTVINIIPNLAHNLKIQMNPISGAGSTVYTLYESPTENGEYRELITSTTSLDYNVIDKYYYRVSVEFGFGTQGALSKKEIQDLSTKEPINWDFDKNYQMTGDVGIYVVAEGSCFEKGTLVMTNRGKVKVENITKNDLVLSFNHFTGKYEYKSIALLVDHGEKTYQVMELYFDDGSYIGFIENHGLFDVDLNKYVDFRLGNYNNYVGHKFIKYDGKEQKVITLIKAQVIEKVTNSYTVVSSENLNCVANDLLNLTTVLYGLYNIFDYDINHCYKKEDVEESIRKYGTYSYDDFKGVVTEKVYVGFGAKYLKIAIAKGILSKDNLDKYIGWLYSFIETGEGKIY